MKIRLNYWQLILLFAPFFPAVGWMFIPYQWRVRNHVNGEMMILLLSIVFLIGICYQAYLVVSFNKKVKGSKWMSFYALAPVIGAVFFVYGCTDLVITSFNSGKLHIAPIESKGAHWAAIIAVLYLLYSLAAFLLIHILYVSIKKIKTRAVREQLSQDFWEPMKKLLITSLLAMAGSIVFAIVADIIKMSVLKNPV